MRKFLTAEWRDLILVNYEVDPLLLRKRTPSGTELDLHDGRCFVSLVGFMFLNTRVLGVRVPYHINFEEVNLRFYVRREIVDEVRRGVTFIKEIVPRRAVCYVARYFYGEPYERWAMSHDRTSEHTKYIWRRSDQTNSITVDMGGSIGTPESGSHAEFITEHYWGYTKRSSTRTDEYKVEHPKWELLEVRSNELAVDFGKVYGKEFASLNEAGPVSVLFAKGSEISVFKGARLGE